MDMDEAWAAYRRLQRMLDRAPINNRAWAIEEAMEVVLQQIAEDRELSPTQIHNLIVNRAAKHRRRQRQDAAFVQSLEATAIGPVDARIDTRDSLARCSSREVVLLVAAATGRTTREIGAAFGAPENTIKTWLRRARLKLAA